MNEPRWIQEPVIMEHDSIGWHCYTLFRLDGVGGIGVQTGPLGGSCKSSWCKYDPVNITGDHRPLGYMLGPEAKATKRNIQKAHDVALERMKVLRPEIFTT